MIIEQRLRSILCPREDAFSPAPTQSGHVGLIYFMYSKSSHGKPFRSSSSFRGGSSSRAPFRRKPFYGSKGGGFSKGNRKSFGQHIDPSRFINKAVITEETTHFVPEHHFKDFAIDERLKQNILSKGYATPTPIQDKAIPHILRGEDVVGIANTGTGKTATFLIPFIHKILLNPKEKILIVVPTRELAIQIDSELKGFIKNLRIFSVCCVGGAPIGRQISALRYDNQFIIGTPGRLKDLIERKHIRLGEFKNAVLDEADRMLDMGFVNDMRYLLSRMPADRHTLCFSATLSREIEGLIKEFLRQPVTISVKTTDTAQSVDQDVVKVGRGSNKVDVLRSLLSQAEFSKVLIFGKTKHGVEKLSHVLSQHGFKAESIHGNKNHSKRQLALRQFKDNAVQILVATDVAARGLDIAGVSHVINYDIPATYDDYVHRIGRTGRAGKKGKALTFIE
jgi:superfamily II DNA/RNA helicase